MGFFETLAAVSVGLALGIPVLMDKVMRPKYEESFSEYRKSNRERLTMQLQRTINKLKKVKKSEQKLTPEMIEEMESLVPKLGKIASEENKLESLLKARKFIFCGWMLSLVLSIFSVQFSETKVFGTNTLGGITVFVFGVVFLVSVGYGWGLFMLDEKLSKFKKFGLKEQVYLKKDSAVLRRGRKSDIRQSISEHEYLETEIKNSLHKYGIYFEASPSIQVSDSMVIRPDFVVPSIQNPEYIIEFKSSLRPMYVGELAHTLKTFKKFFTDTKGILVTNTNLLSKAAIDQLHKDWDFLVDVDDLNKLKKIIKK